MARKKAETVVEGAVAAAVEAVETVKKTRTRKTAAKKTAEETAEAPKKRATRASKKEAEVFVQWWGKEVSTKEVAERIKAIWTGEMGKKESELKDLKIYIKPEEDLAHYVINGEITGHIEV
ncbi:MAG: DUF6465 family protein [Eubacteriales bacterium]|nr:DUF6465 family protein [Eubacteriales bacterium]